MHPERQQDSRSAAGLAILMVLLLLAPPARAAAPPPQPGQTLTPYIYLENSDVQPAEQVFLYGSQFSNPGMGRVEFYWETLSSPIIGSTALISTYDTFGGYATIPPSATEGAHTLIARHSYTGEQATTTCYVSGLPKRALIVYKTDQALATGIKDLLKNWVLMDSDLVPIQQVANLNMSGYGLILIAPDTGREATWGTTDAVTRIRDSGLPILGMGRGGAALLGKLHTHVGEPYVGLASTYTKQVTAVSLLHPVFDVPYALYKETFDVYTSHPIAVEVVYPPAHVQGLGSDPLAYQSYFLAQQAGRYLLWGWEGPVADMTYEGQNLFVNTILYLLGYRPEVDTLILTDFGQMEELGYSADLIGGLYVKVEDLVHRPPSESHMVAVVRALDKDTGSNLGFVRQDWQNWEDHIEEVNEYVAAIDTYVEALKRGIYPNLRYLILVGAHEVIPMQARPADGNFGAGDNEAAWAEGLPRKSGYLYELYHDTSDGAVDGHYLTDSIYSDLSWIPNGYGLDDVLIPELAVGRLVETPEQISKQISAYLAADGGLRDQDMAAIGSSDMLDSASRAAKFMGRRANTSLIQEGFLSSKVPALLNTNHDVVMMAGHSSYNMYTARKWDQTFYAGSHPTQGDTEELGDLSGAVIVTDGCHAGLNLGNKTYTADNATWTYADFAERYAAKGVGIFVASTGFGIGSASGARSDPGLTCCTETLASNFINHLLHDRSKTAGNAYKAAIDEYIQAGGGFIPTRRYVVAPFTFYGIPHYGWRAYDPIPMAPPEYSIERWPLPYQGQHTLLTIGDWTVKPDGFIEVPGLMYDADDGLPFLPVVHVRRIVPPGPGITDVTWDEASSVSITFANDVPLLVQERTGSGAQRQIQDGPGFSVDGFYPSTPFRVSNLSTLGGGAVVADLVMVPVQYNPSTGQTRVWTEMAFDMWFGIDETGLELDSDGDDLPDYWESGYGLSPTDAQGDQGRDGDPDDDGLSNLVELELSTDPLHADTDGDGDEDGTEVAHDTDPLNPGSHLERICLPAVVNNRH